MAGSADDVGRLSEALVRDPASLAFLPLGEALRRRGDVEAAHEVARRGVERHPELADARDLLARVLVDLGDVKGAAGAWETALQLVPSHLGALRGLGFLCFQAGWLVEAKAYLEAALDAEPADESTRAALETVRTAVADPGGTPVGVPGLAGGHAAPGAWDGAAAALLFDDLMGDVPGAALLLDADGLVLAGHYPGGDAGDRASDVGGHLSGVSDEAGRAMRHLGLGAWTQLVFETEAATVAMAPAGSGVVMVAAARGAPLGWVRRLLGRAAARARRWLGEGA